MNKEKKITVFGDSIGKGVFTDGGKIEVIKDNAVRLFEDWKGVEIDNRSGYGQSLKRLLDNEVIERFKQCRRRDGRMYDSSDKQREVFRQRYMQTYRRRKSA